MPPAAIAELAVSLARPVVRGYLPLAHAHATLLAGSLRLEREGRMPHDALAFYRGARHVLAQVIENEHFRRELTETRIKRRLKPLILRRHPPNVLRAEAHHINGADGFPFAEAEVNRITADEVYWSLPIRRRNHA